MKLNATSAIALILLIVVAGVVFGTWQIPNITNNTNDGTITPWNPNPTAPPATSSYSGLLYFEVTNAILGTGVTTSTTTVDVISADASGAFNAITPAAYDTKAQAANPQAMSTVWREGTELLINVDCTGNPSNGLDYYPSLYYVKLSDGATIYKLTSKACFQQVGSSPATYRINPTAGTPLTTVVSEFTSSNVNYWNLGKLSIVPRMAAADFDTYLAYNGATLSSVTDGSSWDDTVSEINANATLASVANEVLTLQMVGANTDLAWGSTFFAFDASGVVHEYGAVLMMSTTATGVATPSGWNTAPISTLYAEKAMYKVVSGVSGSVPAHGSKAGFTISIPLDTTACTAATQYYFKFWINDCQNLDNVANAGVSATYPPARGFVTAYGVGEVLQNTAFTISSGGGATCQLMTLLTTPS